MITEGAGVGAGSAFVLVAALLAAALSPAVEILIARFLPRLGGTPAPPARITTAALTGAACAAFALRFGVSWTLPAFLFLAVLGIQLARIDFSLHLLPNPLVLVLLTGGALLLLAGTAANGHWEPAVRAAAGCTLLFVTYLALALMTPGAIGMGDIKLAAPIGLYLGYLGWMHLLYGGLLGFVVNGVVTIVTVARSREAPRPAEVAHGPSMLIAAAAVALFLPSLN